MVLVFAVASLGLLYSLAADRKKLCYRRWLPPLVAAMGECRRSVRSVRSVLFHYPHRSKLTFTPRARALYGIREKILLAKKAFFDPFSAKKLGSQERSGKVLIVLIVLTGAEPPMAAKPLPWRQKTANQHNVILLNETESCVHNQPAGLLVFPVSVFLGRSWAAMTRKGASACPAGDLWFIQLFRRCGGCSIGKIDGSGGAGLPR